jgi:hypothetical protein
LRDPMIATSTAGESTLANLVRLRHKLSPGDHDRSALLECVVTRIGTLDGVADRVCQCKLQQLGPEVSSLSTPISEGAAHPVHDGRSPRCVRGHRLAFVETLDHFVERVLAQAAES